MACGLWSTEAKSILSNLVYSCTLAAWEAFSNDRLVQCIYTEGCDTPAPVEAQQDEFSQRTLGRAGGPLQQL